MKKVYIYGTGSKALKFLPSLSLHFQIVGFLDSDPAKQGQQLMNIDISHVSSISAESYDDIVIVSSYVNEINMVLAEHGLNAGIPLEELDDVLETQLQYLQLNNQYRQQLENTLPRVPLKAEHLVNARIITDRVALLELLPKGGIVAELGVANGDYTKLILEKSIPKKLHLIDIWHSQRYGQTLFNNVCSKFEKELSKGQAQIHRNLSSDAAQDFPEQYFDWIYIDTSHCYQGTKKELELYASKIKDGGIIAGHDYTMANWSDQLRYGVMEAVHEFCVIHGWRIKYLTMDLSENQSFAIEKIPQN